MRCFRCFQINGSLLSDFNKGGSLSKCLEQALFVWTAIAFDLLTTSLSICATFGIIYGFASTITSLGYICWVLHNARRSLPWSRDVVEAKRRKDAVAKPILGAVLDIASQNGIKEELDRFREAQKKYHDLKCKTTTVLIFHSTLPNVVFMVAFLIMSIFVVWQGQKPKFIVFFTLMKQLLETLNSLGASAQTFLGGLVDTERTLCVLMEECNAENSTDGKGIIEAANLEFGQVYAEPFEEPLSFCLEKNAIFELKCSNRAVLTPAYLLRRIIKPRGGVINIGGIDIREYSLSVLRQKVAFVPRDFKLLGSTIMQSLKYGLGDLWENQDEAIKAACRKVNIHNSIVKITSGYNAPNVEGNSMGREERRRLALARSLLQTPQILVLEGNIAAIEGEMDSDLQDVIDGAFSRRTVLICT